MYKIEVESFSGNITITISEHYSKFLLLTNKGQKERKLIRDYKRIDKKNSETDLKSTNSNQIIKLNLSNTDDSFEIFLELFPKHLINALP